MTTTTDTSWLTLAFIERYLGDREAGGVRPLREYLARWPGHEERIAQEYLTLQKASDEANPVEAVRPTSIGPYEIVGELGRGGQAVVYLAEDPRLRRRVALKVLPAPFGVQGAATTRLRREAEAMSKVHHPGICPVYDVGEDEATVYIAMRYIEGISLARHLEACRRLPSDATRIEGTAPPTNDGTTPSLSPSPSISPSIGQTHLPLELDDVLAVVGFFEKAARALHAIHDLGFIHRDVKPGNIMVTLTGDPVILDFGLARDTEATVGQVTLTGDVVGTPAYLSPEQVSGEPRRLDCRTDVWSLGVALFEALAGRRPFDAPVRHHLYQAILTQEPPDIRRLAPSVSKDLASVVMTALEKDSDRRYASAAALADDLGRVRIGLPVRARPAGPLRRIWRMACRNPLVTGSLILVFAALTAALLVNLRSLDQAERARAETTEALGRDRERLNLFRSLTHRLARTIEAESDQGTGSLPAQVRFATSLRDATMVLLGDGEGDARLHGQLAEAWMRLGDTKGSPAKPSLGDPLGAAADYAEAKRVLDAADSRFPGDASLAHLRVLIDVRELALAAERNDPDLQTRGESILARTGQGAREGITNHVLPHTAVLEALGDLAMKRGDWEEATRRFEACLALKRTLRDRSPSHAAHVPHIATKLARCALAGQDFQRAEELLLEAIDDAETLRGTNPTSVFALDKVGDAWFQLGNLRTLEQRHDAAVAAYREAAWARQRLLDAHPESGALHTGVRATLDRVILAAQKIGNDDVVQTAEREKVILEGERIPIDQGGRLRAATRLSTQEGSLHDDLQALTWLRQAAYASPPDARLCYEVARLCHRTGQGSEATRWARRGLESLAEPADSSRLRDELQALIDG